MDETRVRADLERRLLQPRDDAEAACAKDLPSFGRGNGGPPDRGPELRGQQGSRSLATAPAASGAEGVVLLGDRQVLDQSEGGSCFRVGAVLSRYADALGFLPGLDSARCATVLSTSRRIALALGRMKYQ
jgi:hypothetical protein